MSRRIKFEKQYERITFGSAPSSRTVEGKMIADHERSETRRINQLLAEDYAPDTPGFWSRFLKWAFSYMKFRDGY